MSFVKKYFNILISFFVLVIFGKELLFSRNTLADNSSEAKYFAEKRSVLIEWGSSSWSGIILSSGLDKIKILTIIHEESMKKIQGSEKKALNVQLAVGKNYIGNIKKWNGCNELSIIEIMGAEGVIPIEEVALESKKSYLSQRLFSFGHPLGLNLHYSEGYLSSLGNKIKPCGMITSGFSGGTVPGQTGSGVWNESGELSGLIVATSAFPIKTLDRDGNQIGTSVVPVTFLGRFVPASEIKTFLDPKSNVTYNSL
jgi:hypothetical protein